VATGKEHEMKTIALIVLLSMFSFGNALAGSFLTGKYEVLLVYGVHDEVNIPLTILENKPIVATLDTEKPFIYNDGIHCSDDDKYVEGLILRLQLIVLRTIVGEMSSSRS
jgi:hypothetical protein